MTSHCDKKGIVHDKTVGQAYEKSNTSAECPSLISDRTVTSDIDGQEANSSKPFLQSENEGHSSAKRQKLAVVGKEYDDSRATGPQCTEAGLKEKDSLIDTIAPADDSNDFQRHKSGGDVEASQNVSPIARGSNNASKGIPSGEITCRESSSSIATSSKEEPQSDPWVKITRASLVLTPEQKARLDAYVAAGYNAAKLQDSDSDVQKQREYVENFVAILIKKLGERYPSFKVREQLGTGSFYHNNRILSPDEFDFLLILCLTNKIIRSDEYDTVHIENNDESLKNSITDILKYKRVAMGSKQKLILTNTFLRALLKAVHESLDELKQEGIIDYRGKRNLKYSVDTLKAVERLKQLKVNVTNTAHSDACSRLLEKSIENLKNKYEHSSRKSRGLYKPRLSKDQTFLDDKLHGPAIRLRVFGPLGPTDIDLGFCIESSRTDAGRYIAIPSNYSLWRLSFYESPSHPKLDEHHRKLLMFFKYILIECKLRDNYILDKDTFNSHILKTFVLVHQETCKQKQHDEDRSLGGCFADTAYHMLEVFDMRMNNKEIEIRYYLGEEKLPDINFPGKTLNRVFASYMSQLFLYTLIEVVKDAPTHHTDHTIDHRLVLAELIAQENKGRIRRKTYYRSYICCPLDSICDIKSKLFSTASSNE